MLDKCVCAAVGELLIASPGTGLQQASTAISPSTTTACMGSFKFAVSNASALKVSPLLPRPRILPRQHQRQQQKNLRPRPKVMMTLGFDTGKPSG